MYNLYISASGTCDIFFITIIREDTHERYSADDSIVVKKLWNQMTVTDIVWFYYVDYSGQ